MTNCPAFALEINRLNSYEFGIEQATENSWGAEITGRGIAPYDFPLQRWVHFAHQILVKQDGIYNIPFYDRKNTSGPSQARHGAHRCPFSDWRSRTCDTQ